MRAVFDREGLLAAFQVVSSVAPSRLIKPVLQNVKLTAAADRTVLLATDIETVGVRMEVRGVQVEEPGEVLLPSARALSIFREARDRDVHVEADDANVMIRTAHSEFELPGEDPSQYPEVAQFSGETYHTVKAGVLREMIVRTLFAAATESARYAMTGVLWELHGEKARLVATDGRRLALVDGPATYKGKHTTEGQTPVVPSRTMNLLEKNLVDPDEEIHVRFGPNDVIFKTNRAEIYGRLVEGRFPPYREVIPKKTSIKIPLSVGPFLSACRQAAILTDDETRGVDYEFAEGKLTLKARVADKGRAKVELPISYEAKAMTVTFDPKLIIDMLRVLDDDAEISLEMVDGNTAALFRAGPHYQYVVMPLMRESR
jgi:DNA polymerase-3 subunit beta